MRTANAQPLHKKKKDRSLMQQDSKSTKSKLLTDKKADLEKGGIYSGYMMKKTSSGSWKKKWCSLRGCVFGFYK